MRTIKNPIEKKDDGAMKVRTNAIAQGTPKIKPCTSIVTLGLLHTRSKPLAVILLPIKRKITKVDIGAKKTNHLFSPTCSGKNTPANATKTNARANPVPCENPPLLANLSILSK